jgi:RND family efflux transporter MFP subunit
MLCGFAGALLAFSAACQSNSRAAEASAPPPRPKVLFTKVVRKDVPMFLEAVASMDGYVNADIRARVRGYLKTQEYKDGGLVRAGQRLFTIESAEYETAVASARATLARARAVAQRNQLQLERDQTLFKGGAVSQSEIDNATTSFADAHAQIDVAQAQLQQALLNLSYTQLRSPIDGIAGVAAVRVGNLVGQDGPTLLTTVSQIDPIRVNFAIGERDYVRNPERYRDLAKRDLRWARQQFAKLESGQHAEHDDPGVELALADGSVYPRRGIVVTAGREIDPSTGTIQLQALVPNPDGFLRPGQYGRVRLPSPNEGRDVLTVPDKALISVQGSYSVGVIGPADTVQLRRIEVGPSVQGERVVLKGLSEGERIVVEGVQKISDGAKVAAEPAPQATALAAPSGTGAASAHK